VYRFGKLLGYQESKARFECPEIILIQLVSETTKLISLHFFLRHYTRCIRNVLEVLEKFNLLKPLIE